MHRLSDALAIEMARLAIENIGREYPNAPGHLLRSADDLRPPRELHPAFYGCLDWHSSVHGHWMLVRLLRHVLTGLLKARGGRKCDLTLDATLTPANIATEVAYFAQPNRQSFERTYGWAWLLQLSRPSSTAGTNQTTASGGRPRFGQPLAAAMVDRYLAFLPKADVTDPHRREWEHGLRPRAGARYTRARSATRSSKALIVERATAYYGARTGGTIRRSSSRAARTSCPPRSSRPI